MGKAEIAQYVKINLLWHYQPGFNINYTTFTSFYIFFSHNVTADNNKKYCHNKKNQMKLNVESRNLILHADIEIDLTIILNMMQIHLELQSNLRSAATQGT